MINMLTQFPEARKYDLSSLEVLAYGGSPMAPEIIQRTRELLPKVKLVQVYGLSETGFLTGLQDQEHTRTSSCPAAALSRHRSAGRRRVREASRNRKAGELVVRGANIMRGYWNNPEETALAFRDGSFRTGDIGYQDSDGYFYILDRLKDMIVTGGENVYSGEVEAVIYAHPAVREAAVFGIPDPKWGELVMACVVLKPGRLSLRMTCRLLPAESRDLKIPRRVEFLDTELPKNGSGKILKRVLRDRFWVNQTRAVS